MREGTVGVRRLVGAAAVVLCRLTAVGPAGAQGAPGSVPGSVPSTLVRSVAPRPGEVVGAGLTTVTAVVRPGEPVAAASLSPRCG